MARWGTAANPVATSPRKKGRTTHGSKSQCLLRSDGERGLCAVSGKEEITQKLSALKTRIDNLVSNGFVTDQASGAFNEMYQNFTTSASNTISSLDGIANGLRSMANAMRETDSQMASQIRG